MMVAVDGIPVTANMSTENDFEKLLAMTHHLMVMYALMAANSVTENTDFAVHINPNNNHTLKSHIIEAIHKGYIDIELVYPI